MKFIKDLKNANWEDNGRWFYYYNHIGGGRYNILHILDIIYVYLYSGRKQNKNQMQIKCAKLFKFFLWTNTSISGNIKCVFGCFSKHAKHLTNTTDSVIYYLFYIINIKMIKTIQNM